MRRGPPQVDQISVVSPARSWGVSVPRTSSSVAKALTISADRRRDLRALSAGVGPARAHRQRILAHRDADAQRRAQLQPTALTVSYSAASSPARRRRPSSCTTELDARQLDRRGQQVGDGSPTAMRPEAGASSAPAACARPCSWPRREARRSRPASRRSRPPAPARADHLVAVAQAAHGAVADGDPGSACWPPSGGAARRTPPAPAHAGQVQRRRARHALHVAVHRGGLPSSTSIGMSIGALAPGRRQHQLRRLGGHAHHRERQRSRSHICSNSGSRSGSTPARSAPGSLHQISFGARPVLPAARAQVEALRPRPASSTSSGRR